MATEPQATFVSYSRDDSDFALRLTEDLKSAGASVWLDQLDIKPGQRWARSVQDALTASPRMLVILSPSSVESTNVDDEISFALEEHKTVIPVLYRECKVPFRLRPFQYIDFRTDYSRGLRILLNNLGSERSPSRETLPPPAVHQDRPIDSPKANAPERIIDKAPPELKRKTPKKPRPEQTPSPPSPTPIYEAALEPPPQELSREKAGDKPVATSPSTLPAKLPLETPTQPISAFHQWTPCIAMFLLSFLSSSAFIFSTNFSPTIRPAAPLMEPSYIATLIFTASLCYMFASPIWGFRIDRIGLWRPALIAVLLWSFALGSQALLSSPLANQTFLSLSVVAVGIGTAAAIPAVFKTVAETLPPAQRSLGLGIAYSGAPLAVILTQLVILPASRWEGYIGELSRLRYAFALIALLGIAWTIFWFILRPNLSTSAQPDTWIKSPRWIRNLLLAAAVYALGSATIAFCLYFVSFYFVQYDYVFTAATRNRFSSILPIVWITGCLFFGPLADRLRLRRTRKPWLLGAFFLSFPIVGFVVKLLPALFTDWEKIAITMLVIAFQMLLGTGLVIFAISDGMALLPKQHIAFFAGICSFASSLSATIVMNTFNCRRTLEQEELFTLACRIAPFLPLLGTVLWLILAKSSVQPAPEPSPEKVST